MLSTEPLPAFADDRTADVGSEEDTLHALLPALRTFEGANTNPCVIFRGDHARRDMGFSFYGSGGGLVGESTMSVGEAGQRVIR